MFYYSIDIPTYKKKKLKIVMFSLVSYIKKKTDFDNLY